MTAVAEATPSVSVEEAAGALIEQVFGAAIGALELGTIYLGVRLGLYPHLVDTPQSATTLGRLAAIDQRYAEEWLEQQAIAGLVDVVTEGDRLSRTYRLSPAQAMVLADPASPFYGGQISQLATSIGGTAPRLVDAYRTGTGISFGGYGDDMRHGQSLFNKFSFLNQLTQQWAPLLGIDELLAADSATAVDLGCGAGWAGIALAKAYPHLMIIGVDSDEESILDARRNAADAGVGDRARFEVASAEGEIGGPYDVAFYFEALHDMSHPVESLVAVRRALKIGGVVVVMDERVEDEFAPNGPPIERILAASSVLHCLPVGRSDIESAATGTLFRTSILRRYAEAAGFTSVDVAPIEHDFFRFYLLH